MIAKDAWKETRDRTDRVEPNDKSVMSITYDSIETQIQKGGLRH